MVLEMKLKLIRDVETGIIAHQVCCTGVIHTGLGKAIAAKWPIVGLEYQRFCGPDAGKKRFVPGKVQMLRVSSIPELWVCSMAGQNLHGSTWLVGGTGRVECCPFPDRTTLPQCHHLHGLAKPGLRSTVR